MESPTTIHQCDYLEPHSPKCYITSEAAELVHINEQIRLLDNHIHQLTELRRALHHRSIQLRNWRSPIYTLPTEILSEIFLQAAGSGIDPFHTHLESERHKANLYQSVALSSVTAHFRRVAFGTADLWKMVPLVLTQGSMDKAIASLLHCLSHAPHVNILIEDSLDRDIISSTIDIFLCPDITPKIKSFDLRSSNAPELWIEKLRLAFVPILDSLSMRLEFLEWETEDEESSNFDLETFTLVTRLRVYGPHLSLPVVIPPSVQVLHLKNVPDVVQIALLYQCQNLVECFTDYDTSFVAGTASVSFSEPLTLTYLKRLTWTPEAGLNTISSVRNLHMPSIEYLKLNIFDNFDTVHSLCCKVSPTLTTLVLETLPYAFDQENLRRLFRTPFPKLTAFGLSFDCMESMLNVFLTLMPRDDESNDSEVLPNLRMFALFFDCSDKVPPRHLLDLLKEWRVGETSYFQVEVNSGRGIFEDTDWSPDLLEELESIIGNRQIDVIWESRRILQF